MVIIKTRIFTRRIKELMGYDEYRELQEALVNRPGMGDIIQGTGGLSQNQFAMLIGVSKRTLENWEQGRRYPTGPAKALLRILDVDPEHAVRALHG